MSLPFSIDAFFNLFARYNAAIWPAQLLAYALGAVVIAMLLADPKRGGPLILATLAVFWAWNGAAYHWLFFAGINPAAYAFGALFVLQAILFAGAAMRAGSVRFDLNDGGLRVILGWMLIIYATVIYELLGYLAGHGLLRGPLFGIAPCPTTIFTIGILLFARGPSVIWLSLIPIAWALIGTSAAIFLGVPEDLGLAVAASTLAGSLLFTKDRFV